MTEGPLKMQGAGVKRSSSCELSLALAELAWALYALEEGLIELALVRDTDLRAEALQLIERSARSA